jgi:hypothetical protein
MRVGPIANGADAESHTVGNDSYPRFLDPREGG